MADKPLDERTEDVIGNQNFIPIDQPKKPGCLGFVAGLALPLSTFYLWDKDRRAAIRNGNEELLKHRGPRSLVPIIIFEAAKTGIYYLVARGISQYF